MYRNEYQLFHWPKQLYLSNPLEKLLEIIDPMDWESLQEHPDDVIESDLDHVTDWEPCYLPEDIRERWGSWNGMWEEMEDVVRQMKRKIPGAHPPGKIAEHDWEAMKNRVLDSVYQETQSHNAPQNPVYPGTVQ